MESQRAHHSDVIMSAIASQITGVSIVCSTVCSGADQRKHQSSASLTFVRGIHRWPVDSPHKGPVTQKMFPFNDAIIFDAFFVVNVNKSMNKQSSWIRDLRPQEAIATRLITLAHRYQIILLAKCLYLFCKFCVLITIYIITAACTGVYFLIVERG